MQNKNIIYGYLVIVLKSEENSEHQVHYHGSLWEWKVIEDMEKETLIL